jgi:hypothetical protein
LISAMAGTDNATDTMAPTKILRSETCTDITS